MVNLYHIESINQKALNYNKLILGDLNKVVNPFLQSNSLNHFSYTRYMEKGQYFSCSLDLNMVEKFYSQNIDKYLFHNNFVLPKGSVKFFYWDLLTSYPAFEFMKELNYSHGLSIFSRGVDNLTQSWHFATDNNNSLINQFYLDHPEQFLNFITYFQYKAHNLIQINDKDVCYTNPNGIFFEESKDEKIADAINLRKYPFNHNGITSFVSVQQFRCLKALANGKCVKSIALELSISPRTVETHLNSIKDKLGLRYKDELVKIYHESLYSSFKNV